MRNPFLFGNFLLIFATSVLGTAQTTYQMRHIAGSDTVGDGGPATAAVLRQAEGLAADGYGNLYIADALDHRVRKVDTQGRIRTVAGTGLAGFAGDGGPAAQAQLNAPYGLLLEPSGALLIADLGNRRIRRIDFNGTIATLAGGGTVDPVSSGGGIEATTASLLQPRNVAMDRFGQRYVSDFAAHRIYQITPDGSLALFAGNGQAALRGDGSSALLGSLRAPAGMSFDSTGTLLVADSGNRAVRTIRNGVLNTLDAAPGGYLQPTGVASGLQGRLAVADAGRAILAQWNGSAWSTSSVPAREVISDQQGGFYVSTLHQVLRFHPALPGGSLVIAGNGFGAYSGDGGPATEARFNSPGGIAVDATGTIYISDTANHRVRAIDGVGIVRTVAGTGTPGFTGDGGPATTAQLSSPSALAFDLAGNLLIADTGNHAIRTLSQNGVLSTFAGLLGQSGYAGDAGSALQASLNAPMGLAVSADGIVLIADTGNSAIRRVDRNGQIATVAGPKTSLVLNRPQAVLADGSGFWIADTGNGAIRYVDGQGQSRTIALTGSARLAAPSALAFEPGGALLVGDGVLRRIFRLDSAGLLTPIAGSGKAGVAQTDGPALALPLTGPFALTASAGSLYAADSGASRIVALDPGAAAISGGLPQVTVLNAGSMKPGPLAPGELVTILGNTIGPQDAAAAVLSTQGTLPTSLGGTEVFFDTVAAPLLYAGGGQINAQVPYAVAGQQLVVVSVRRNGREVAGTVAEVALANPGLFADASNGQAVAINADGSLNAPLNPAARGSFVTLYATGEGLRNPPATDGTPAPQSPLALPQLTVSATYNQQPAEVLFAGGAPGLTGVLQVNVKLPGGFAPSGTWPLTLLVGGVASPPALLSMQ